jgi:hypothetical protein
MILFLLYTAYVRAVQTAFVHYDIHARAVYAMITMALTDHCSTTQNTENAADFVPHVAAAQSGENLDLT